MQTAEISTPSAAKPTFESVYTSLDSVIGKIPPPALAPPTGKVANVPWTQLDKILGGEGSIEQQVVHRYELNGFAASAWASFFACPCGKTMMRGAIEYRVSDLQEGIRRLRNGKIEIDAIDVDSGSIRVSISAEGDAVGLASAVRRAADARSPDR